MELSDIRHNEEVISLSDPTFRAYFAGSMDPGADGAARVMVVVKEPGKSGLHLHANKPWPLADLTKPAPEGRHK